MCVNISQNIIGKGKQTQLFAAIVVVVVVVVRFLVQRPQRQAAGEIAVLSQISSR